MADTLASTRKQERLLTGGDENPARPCHRSRRNIQPVYGTARVVVALIADPSDPFQRTASEEEWTRPYAQRRKVEFDVADSDSLADVLERAAEKMGLKPSFGSHIDRFSASHNKVAFYKPEDEEGFAPRHVPRFLLSQLTLVDEQGRAVFGVRNLRAVRYSDLLLAADAGTLDGEPLRPYLIIEPGYGDWVGPDWPTLLEGLKISWQLLEHLATAGGAFAGGKLVRDEVRKRLRSGEGGVETNREWAQRDTMPYQFAALVRSRDWQTSELAALFGCSESDAEGVLFVLGFGFDEAGRAWRYRGDPAAEVMSQIFRELEVAAHEHGDELERELIRRLTVYFERGTSVLLERSDSDDETFEYRPTPGERIDKFIDGAIGLGRRARQAWRSRQR